MYTQINKFNKQLVNKFELGGVPSIDPTFATTLVAPEGPVGGRGSVVDLNANPMNQSSIYSWNQNVNSDIDAFAQSQNDSLTYRDMMSDYGNSSSEQQKKLDSGTWKKITAEALTGLGGIATGVMNNAQIKDTTGYESDISRINNRLADQNNYDTALNNWNSLDPAKTVTSRELMGTKAQRAAGVAKTGLSGMTTGAAIGGTIGSVLPGLGTLAGTVGGGIIGAAAGTIAGAAGNLVNRFRAGKKANSLTNQYALASKKAHSNQNLAFSNITKNNNFNILSNIAEKGGFINTFADGGDMFNSGYSYIGAGGTHDDNPNQGIQIGVDPQGIPNMVEEGEVVLHNDLTDKGDYVLSKNKLKPTKDTLAQFKIPTAYEGMSFADIFMEMSKGMSETPNDPIAKRTLKRIVSRLIQAQELERQKEQQQEAEMMQMMQAMGMDPQQPMGLESQMEGMNPNEQAMQEQMMQEQMMAQQQDPSMMMQPTDQEAMGLEGLMAYGGPVNRFDEAGMVSPNYNMMWNHIGRNIPVIPGKDTTTKIPYSPYTSEIPYFEYQAPKPTGFQNNNPTPIDVANLKKPIIPVNPNDPEAVAKSKMKPIITTPDNRTDYQKFKDNEWTPNYESWKYGRLVPGLGSALSLAHNIFNKPDYSDLEDLKKQAELSRKYMPSSFSPIGDYMEYKPIDRNYYGVKAGQNHAASIDNIRNLNNGNQSAAMANIVNADAKSIIARADAEMKAEAENWKRYQDAKKFNQDTNKFNATGAFESSKANADFYSRATGTATQGLAAAAELKYKKDKDRAEAINSDLTNVTQTLHDWFLEKEEKDKMLWALSNGLMGNPKYKPHNISWDNWYKIKTNMYKDSMLERSDDPYQKQQEWDLKREMRAVHGLPVGPDIDYTKYQNQKSQGLSNYYFNTPGKSNFNIQSYIDTYNSINPAAQKKYLEQIESVLKDPSIPDYEKNYIREGFKSNNIILNG